MNNDDVAMIEVESGDVLQMRDASFSELLDEINFKASQTRMSAAFAYATVAISLLAGLATGGPGLLLGVIALPAWAIGRWVDAYRRTTVLFYDLEDDAEAAYARLVQGFDGLIGCAAKWHIEAAGAIQSVAAWKRNAGASHLVSRRATTLDHSLPVVIKSNVTPPALRVGKQVMFFMPDVVLVQDGSRLGAVNYVELNVRWQSSRFIETDRVPPDARIVDQTWKHPNKNGGPDRRFRDNKQIPVCLYEAMYLTSKSGVNELVEFSKTGVVAAFSDGCRMLAALPRQRMLALPSASNGDGPDVAPVNATGRRRGSLKTASLAVLSVLVGIPLLAIALVHGSKKTDNEIPPDPVLQESRPPSAVEKRLAAPAQLKADGDPQITPVVAPDAAQLEPSTKENAEQTRIRYTKTAANLRKGPSAKFDVITVVPKGVDVLIVEANGAWSLVRVNPNTTGWMANSTIAEH